MTYYFWKGNALTDWSLGIKWICGRSATTVPSTQDNNAHNKTRNIYYLWPLTLLWSLYAVLTLRPSLLSFTAPSLPLALPLILTNRWILWLITIVLILVGRGSMAGEKPLTAWESREQTRVWRTRCLLCKRGTKVHSDCWPERSRRYGLVKDLRRRRRKFRSILVANSC